MVRELRVVALTADGREILFSARSDGRPTHSVAIDDRLTRALRGQHPDGAPDTPARMSPRDIQALLRAGATVEEVAAQAGVPAARVERFAGPIRSEQEQVVSAAQTSVLRKARAGRSALPLADAVAMNLGAVAAARPPTAVWSAARQPDGHWTVLLHVTVRGRSRIARWRYDPAAREVAALDAYAGQLGFVEEPGAPRPSRARTVPAGNVPPRPPVTRRADRTAPAPAPARAPAEKGRAPRPARPVPSPGRVAGGAAAARAGQGAAAPADGVKRTRTPRARG